MSTQLADNEISEARAEVEAAALAQKARVEQLLADEDARPVAPRVDRSGLRGMHGINTKAGALMPAEVPPTAKPKYTVEDLRALQASGVQLNADAQARLVQAERDEEAARIQLEEDQKQATTDFRAAVNGYTEEQDHLFASAQALIAEYEALAARRNKIEVAFRRLGMLGLSAKKPPRISERILRREGAYGADHYLPDRLRIPIGTV